LHEGRYTVALQSVLVADIIGYRPCFTTIIIATYGRTPRARIKMVRVVAIAAIVPSQGSRAVSSTSSTTAASQESSFLFRRHSRLASALRFFSISRRRFSIVFWFFAISFSIFPAVPGTSVSDKNEKSRLNTWAVPGGGRIPNASAIDVGRVASRL
jgi:hypothetical protein